MSLCAGIRWLQGRWRECSRVGVGVKWGGERGRGGQGLAWRCACRDGPGAREARGGRSIQAGPGWRLGARAASEMLDLVRAPQIGRADDGSELHVSP